MRRIAYDPKFIGMCHRLEDITYRNVKIVEKRPPNFDAIQAVFPTCGKPGVIFAYGDTIFNPWGSHILNHILAHEATHLLQQREIGGPEKWWEQYLAQQEFRFVMELDAHRIELRNYALTANRQGRRSYPKIVAGKLSGPLYNNMIRTKDAEKLIKMEIDDVVAV